jgi:hypothetical protein
MLTPGERAMKTTLQSLLSIVLLAAATHAAAQITFYDREGFRGRSLTADQRAGDLGRQGFNDRAASIVVQSGSWEVCEHARFEGRCVVLRPGEYPSLRSMGLTNAISSFRPLSDDWRAGRGERPPAYGPQGDDWRAGRGERPPAYEPYAVPAPGFGRREPPAVVPPPVFVPRGGDLPPRVDQSRATNEGTTPAPVTSVRRTGENNWDVTYVHEGVEHRIQMSAPPGPTIPIGPDGQPRIVYR